MISGYIVTNFLTFLVTIFMANLVTYFDSNLVTYFISIPYAFMLQLNLFLPREFCHMFGPKIVTSYRI